MAAFLGVSGDVYNTWFLQLTFDELDLNMDDEEPTRPEIEDLDDEEEDEEFQFFDGSLNWNQYIQGTLKMKNVNVDFESYTMVADSDPQGFDYINSEMSEN